MTKAVDLAKTGSLVNSSGQVPLATGVSGTLPVANGGTGATTQAGAAAAVLPTQTGNSGKYLSTDGANASWSTVTQTRISGGTTGLTPSTLTGGDVTLAGTLAVANGGTGSTTLTANNVLLGNGTSALQSVAPGTSGNLLTSNGTTWVSSAPSGGVTSLNGQTGAITNTTYGAIGSYVAGTPMANAGESFSGGSTFAGSSIRGMTSFGGSGGSSSSTWTTTQSGGLGLSGTWRAMGGARNGSGKSWYYAGTILVRIS